MYKILCGAFVWLPYFTSYGCRTSLHMAAVLHFTADLLSEVCHNVGTEPGLQPITDERMTCRTANREDGARLDVVAQWGRDLQCAYFDIRVFNPFAQSYLNTSLAQCYRRNEQEKKREYEHKVISTPHWPSAIEGMNRRKRENMSSEYVKLNMVLSHHWFSLHLEAWVTQLQLCTRGWHHFMLKNSTSPIARPSTG